MPTITIRASSLDDAADCPRRHALRMFREIQQRYEKRQPKPPIGGLVGSAVHYAAQLMWQGQSGKDAEGNALAIYASMTTQGVELDATTPSLYVGSKQAVRGIRTYETQVMPRIKPARFVEDKFEAQISSELLLSGSPDLTTEDHVLRDYKNEIRTRPHLNQIGAYALLLRSNGYKVRRAVIDHIKRQSEKQMRQQPPHYEEIEYKVADVEASAHQVIKRTEASLIEYRKREADKDERPYLAFAANPSSVLCSEKYCPAYNTPWCPEGSQWKKQSNG